jgi:predicted DNA-binding transcriptional regulator AlpA
LFGIVLLNALPMGIRAAKGGPATRGVLLMPDVIPAATAPLLLTRRAAAAVLSISERTLWSLTWPRGPIRPVRIGRSVRYSADALQTWVEAQGAGEGGAA